MSEPDPFRAAREASVRRWAIAAAVTGAATLAVGALLVMSSGRHALRPALPAGIVAQLRAAPLQQPLDVATGYQRLGSVLPPGAEIEAAALAEDGTLALVSMVPSARAQRALLVLRGGVLSARRLETSRASLLAFTPENELYIGFDDGQLATLAPGADASALADAARGAAPASTVTGIAFDRATKKTAVVFAGGEVWSALRPFQPGALRAVTIPPNARVRHAAFTRDSELVLAGDSGQVFVSRSDAWDAIPLATSGSVVALASDLAGDLLVAQSNGALFRYEGGWDSLGQAPAMPIGIGELGALGVVVVLADGRVLGASASHTPTAVTGYVPRGAAISGQIAGLHALVLSRERLVVAQLGEAPLSWSSDAAIDAPGFATASGPRAVLAMPRHCRVVDDAVRDALGPPLPMLSCDGAPMTLAAAGMRPAAPMQVAGRALPASEWLRLLRADRDVAAVGGQLLRAHHEDEPPALLAFRPETLGYTPLLALPPEEGAIVGWSAAAGAGDTLELVTTSVSGSVRFARVPPRAAGAATDTPPRAAGAVTDAPSLIASVAAFHALRLEQRRAFPVALGDGHIVFAYPRYPTLVARLDAAAPERLEPVPVLPDPPAVRDADSADGPALFAAGGAAWLARPGLLERIGATGDGVRMAEGVTLALTAGTTLADARGTLHALASRTAPASPTAGDTDAMFVLSCDATRCRERALPAGVRPTGLFVADDGRLGAVDTDGSVGVFTR